MKWNELSDNAKGIIEWVENPFTNKKENIEIKVGEKFERDLPKGMGFRYEKIKISITQELYDEIVKFVSNDDNLEIISNDPTTKTFIFQMKETMKLH